MSLLWQLLDGGTSIPRRTTRGQRVALWCGRRLALRHRHVEIPKSCLIHPEARIHPRNGRIRFGEGCEVGPGAMVQGNVELGDRCSIQAGSILVGYGRVGDGSGLIRIGHRVRIAPMVLMFAADHEFGDASRPIHGQGLKHMPITIEDNVWIASRVNITAGVTIGHDSIIAAGAVVTKDVPPFSVVAGVPGKVIKSRSAEEAGTGKGA